MLSKVVKAVKAAITVVVIVVGAIVLYAIFHGTYTATTIMQQQGESK